MSDDTGQPRWANRGEYDAAMAEERAKRFTTWAAYVPNSARCEICLRTSSILLANSPAGPWRCHACASRRNASPPPFAADDPFLPEGPPPSPCDWRRVLHFLGVVLLCLGAWAGFLRLCGGF